MTVGFRMDFPVSKDVKPVATFDLETVKLSPMKVERWTWPSGETSKLRWLPVVFGFGFIHRRKFHISVFYENDERKFIEAADDLLLWATKEYGEVTYHSRNKFDEMVLKGRFINARARLAEAPGQWPTIDKRVKFTQIKTPVARLYDRRDEKLDWKDLVYGSKEQSRGHLISSKFTDKLGMIMKHCARDISENIGLKVL